MSDTGKQIKKLLSSTNLSADKITKPLKAIGDGDMLNGVKTISRTAFKNGEIRGIIEGGGVVLSIGTLCCMTYHLVQAKREEWSAHKEDEKKILEALENEAIQQPGHEQEEQDEL